MKSIACILAPVLMLTVLLAAAPASKPAGQTIADSKGDFTITIPPTWKQGTLKRDGLRVMGPPPAGTRAYPMFQAQRGLQPDAADKPLDDSAKAIIEQVTKRPVAETKIATLKLDGVDARQFKVTLTADDKPVDFDYVIAVNKSQLFVLNFMQEQSHYDAAAAQAVIDSFRWSK